MPTYGPPFAPTPADLASLQNTLTPAGLLTLADVERQRMEQETAARSAQAAREASSAGQQFQQAAAAPPQGIDPLTELVTRLSGNIASTLSGDQGYKQNAETDLATKRKTLLQQRADNLVALKDVYDKKAALAAHLGDVEQEEKARGRSEQLSRTLQVLLENQRGEQQMAVEKLRGENALKEVGARGAQSLKEIAARGEQDRLTNAADPSKSATGGAGDLTDFVDIRDTPGGQRLAYIDLTKAGTPTEQGKLYRAARAAGIPTVGGKMDNPLPLIDAVRGTMNVIEQEIFPLLPAQRRGLIGAMRQKAEGAANQFEKTLQLGEKGAALAGYAATRTNAIQTIQALASLGKGLRINQAEIKAAQEFDYPRVTDTQETARRKFGWLRTMLENIEKESLGHPPTDAEVRALLKEAAELKHLSRKDRESAASAAAVDRYDANGNLIRGGQ